MTGGFDVVVVVGLGALGSSAAWVLARAGARVLGLEQFALGHHRGASHDHARIIRRSYHTPAYVRLASLVYRSWAELEWEAEERLVVTTGGLDLFPASSAIPPGPYRSSLEACGVPYQWLDAAEVMRRWPAFRLDADVGGLWQADGGMVPAARGTRLMRRLAAGYGVTLRSQAPVTALRDRGGWVEVATATTASGPGGCCSAPTPGPATAGPARRRAAPGRHPGAVQLFPPGRPGRLRRRPVPGLDLDGRPQLLRLPGLAGHRPQGRPGRRRPPAPAAASPPTRPPPNIWPGSCAPACPAPPAATTTLRPASTP